MTNQNNNQSSQRELVSTKQRLQKRLNQYWKIERINIFLLPIVATFVVAFRFQNRLTLAFDLSLVATVWLLVIGTMALKMLQKRLEGDSSFESRWLPILHLAQLPSLALVATSGLVTAWDVFQSFPAFDAARIAAIGFTVLAVLEYINYYHRQLQHFDNATDFQRLCSGRGFRKSHLASSLEKWRKSRLDSTVTT